MRLGIALALLAFSSTAIASGMSPVAESSGYCKGKDGICYEWQLTSDASIRFIAYGSEQGIDYSFYRSKSGHYQQLIRIYPVLRDKAHPETLYWGYPQDIEDISVSTTGFVQASFRHSIDDDGEVYSPKWQNHIPAVLFTGTTTQPQMRIEPISFLPYSLNSLRQQAGANYSFKATPLRGAP